MYKRQCLGPGVVVGDIVVVDALAADVVFVDVVGGSIVGWGVGEGDVMALYKIKNVSNSA